MRTFPRDRNADRGLRRVTGVSLSLLVLGVHCQSAFGRDLDLATETEYLSANGKYRFVVSPPAEVIDEWGHCRGTLYEKTEGGWQRRMSRYLLNDHAPAVAYVSNSGKHVVTLGEWIDPMTLPFVVYGSGGPLGNCYGHIEQLVPMKEVFRAAIIRARHQKTPERRWSELAICGFTPTESHFIAWLSADHVLVFRLPEGELVDNGSLSARRTDMSESAAASWPRKELKREALKMALRLTAAEGRQERQDGEFMLAQYQDSESVEMLRELRAKEEKDDQAEE